MSPQISAPCMTLHDKAVEAAITEERITVETRFPDAAHWPNDYDEEEQVFMRVKMAAAIRAYLAAMAAAGWKLTSREATEEMMFAGHEAARKVQVSGISGMTIDAQMRNKSAREIAAWSAMHDAAPSPEEAP